jgi:MarR family transcriptional regulator, organic hydroperoxide resistance regulator
LRLSNMWIYEYYGRMSNDASEAWGLLFRLFVSQRGRVPQVAAEFELSPMQAHVLRLLEPDQPLPMRTLARKLCCDASNVTGIVDRLEERGLVRRDASPGDRRVKMLVVTSDGVLVRRRMLKRLSQAPEPIARLSLDDQRALREILVRALEHS